MLTTTLFTQARAALRQRWQAAAPRERRLLALAAALLGLLLALGLAESAAEQRQRLRRALPQTTAQLAQMQGWADEIVALRGQPAPPRQAGPALLAALQAAARAEQLDVDLQLAGGVLQASGRGHFDAMLRWLAGVQRDYALRPTQLDIVRDGAQARLSVSFEQP